jgi:hypothetical protein
VVSFSSSSPPQDDPQFLFVIRSRDRESLPCGQLRGRGRVCVSSPAGPNRDVPCQWAARSFSSASEYRIPLHNDPSRRCGRVDLEAEK